MDWDRYEFAWYWTAFILKHDLGFAIWSQESYLPRVSQFSHLFAKLISQLMTQWMKCILVPLICCVPEHKSLITSSKVIFLLFLVDSIEYFLTLRHNIDKNCHCSIVESLWILIIIANILAYSPNDGLIIHGISDLLLPSLTFFGSYNSFTHYWNLFNNLKHNLSLQSYP